MTYWIVNAATTSPQYDKTKSRRLACFQDKRQSARKQPIQPVYLARKNQGGWSMEVVLHDAQHRKTRASRLRGAMTWNPQARNDVLQPTRPRKTHRTSYLSKKHRVNETIGDRLCRTHVSKIACSRFDAWPRIGFSYSVVGPHKMTLPDFLKEDYSRFAFTADEWLVSYAHMSASFVSTYAATFSMAMTIELYLKAYYAYLAEPEGDATKYKHGIARLYQDLEQMDTKFPANIKLNTKLSTLPLHELDRESWQSNWFLALSTEDQREIRQHYEVYMVMAYASDLKYGISPALPRHSGRVISSAWSHLNPWIAEFVLSIRKRIGHPKKKVDDRLHYALLHPDLDRRAAQFIEDIHSRSFENA